LFSLKSNSTLKKTAEALIDQALAKLEEAIALTAEYEGTTGYQTC
jgi:hypothetical protein